MADQNGNGGNSGNLPLPHLFTIPPRSEEEIRGLLDEARQRALVFAQQAAQDKAVYAQRASEFVQQNIQQNGQQNIQTSQQGNSVYNGGYIIPEQIRQSIRPGVHPVHHEHHGHIAHSVNQTVPTPIMSNTSVPNIHTPIVLQPIQTSVVQVQPIQVQPTQVQPTQSQTQPHVFQPIQLQYLHQILQQAAQFQHQSQPGQPIAHQINYFDPHACDGKLRYVSQLIQNDLSRLGPLGEYQRDCLFSWWYSIGLIPQAVEFLRLIINDAGTDFNFDTSNGIRAEHLLLIMAARIPVTGGLSVNDVGMISEQLSDIHTGRCPAGRVDRLLQIYIPLRERLWPEDYQSTGC